MAEEKEETGIPWGLIIFVAILILISVLVYWQMTPWLHEEEISSYLKEQIEGRDNVSQEYINGWNDCIEEYHRWFRRATNITNNLMEYTCGVGV